MKYKGALALAIVLQTGCVSFDTVPEMYARSQWKGRPAKDAIDFFGPPQKMDRTADGKQVVMQWYRDTSYNSNESAGMIHNPRSKSNCSGLAARNSPVRTPVSNSKRRPSTVLGWPP